MANCTTGSNCCCACVGVVVVRFGYAVVESWPEEEQLIYLDGELRDWLKLLLVHVLEFL